jgi:hypothetical protein
MGSLSVVILLCLAVLKYVSCGAPAESVAQQHNKGVKRETRRRNRIAQRQQVNSIGNLLSQLGLSGTFESNDTGVLPDITKQFFMYSLHFGHYSDLSSTNGGYPIEFCYRTNQTSYNSTQDLLSRSIKFCANDRYFPRILSRSQISWKKRPRKARKSIDALHNSSIGNATNETDLGSSDHAKKVRTEEGANKTTQKRAGAGTGTGTGTGDEEESDEEENKNDRVHPHLVFVLLLPDHPYSQNMQRAIATVSSAYPQVTVVMGNAYEFIDMQSKYRVMSFPKALYFRAGMFVDSFDGAVDVSDIAARFTQWTLALPQTLPIPFGSVHGAGAGVSVGADGRHVQRSSGTTHSKDSSLSDISNSSNINNINSSSSSSITDNSSEHPEKVKRSPNRRSKKNRKGYLQGLHLDPIPAAQEYVLLNASQFQFPFQFQLQVSECLHTAFVALSSLAGTSGVGTFVQNVWAGTKKKLCYLETSTSMPAASFSSTLRSSFCHSTWSINAGNESLGAKVAESSPDSSNMHGVEIVGAISSRSVNDVASNDSFSSTPTNDSKKDCIISIYIPTPNLEPFLGSVENYVWWETTFFVLGAVYTFMRVVHSFYKSLLAPQPRA